MAAVRLHFHSLRSQRQDCSSDRALSGSRRSGRGGSVSWFSSCALPGGFRSGTSHALAVTVFLLGGWLAPFTAYAGHGHGSYLECPTTAVEEGGSIRVNLVYLSPSPNHEFSAFWHTDPGTADASDYTVQNRVPSGKIGAPRHGTYRASWTFQTTEDSVVEEDETFTVRFSPATQVIDRNHQDRDETCELTILNDDPGVLVSKNSLTIQEGAQDTYTVRLATQPSGNVTVTPRSANTSTARVSPSTLTFTRQNWDTVQEVLVRGENDDALNPQVKDFNNRRGRTTRVVHGISGGGYDGVTVADAPVFVADDDGPPSSVNSPSTDDSDYASIKENACADGGGAWCRSMRSIPSATTVAHVNTLTRDLTNLQPVVLRHTAGEAADSLSTMTSSDVEVTLSPSSVEENGETQSVTLTVTLVNGPLDSPIDALAACGSTEDTATYGVDLTATIGEKSCPNTFDITIDAGSTSGTARIDVTPTVDANEEGDETVNFIAGVVIDGRATSDKAILTIVEPVAPPGKPAAPTVSATVGSTTSLDVRWRAPANTRPAIESYDLRYRAGSSGNWIDGPQDVTTTSTTLTGLEASTSHQVQVRATNDEGNGPWSDPGSGTTASPAPPGKPTAPAVSATAGSTTSLDVRWRAPANTSPAIESYDLRYRAGTSGNWIDGPQDVTTTSTTLTGLEASTSHQVQVRATNARGDGPWSDPGSGTTSSPTNTAPTFDETSYTFTLAENADGRTTPVPIGRVTATDADTGDVVTYSITAGNPGNRFMINASTGALLYVGSGENYEGFSDPATAFVLTVQASDGTAHSSVSVMVRVTDVAESAAPDAPPELGEPDADVLTFGEAIIANQHYVPHAAIPLLTLPAATGGAGPFTYALSPALPAGLTFDPATRQISGTPTAPQGATIYTYRVRDRDGETVELTFTLAVTLPVASLTAGAASVPEGGVAPFTVTLSGPAPAGGLTVRMLVMEAAGGAFVAAPHEGPQTLTIPAGATAQRYEVPTVANEVEEAAGRITVELQPGPGYTVSAQAARAAVTVTDDDRIGIERGWLARVGRTVGTHVTDALSTRLRPGADAAAHVTVGGTRLALGAARPGAAAAASRGAGVLASVAGLLGLSPGGTPDAPFGEATPVPRPGPGQALAVDLRHLLVGSAFRLHLGAAEAGAARLTAWGRVAGTRFSGRDGARALEGDLLTGTVGVDRAWGRWLAGVAVSHTWGDGGLQATSGPVALEQTLTSLHPYLRYAVTDRLDVWGVLGYGWGDVTRTPDAGAEKATDTTMLMGALGSRGVLRTAAEPGGVDLALRTDLLLTRTTADAVTGAQGWLAAAEGAAHRLRLVLEGARGVTWAEGRQLTPTLQVGLRHDWGDAETGFGLEVGGRVQYADPTLGLTVEGAVRGLVVHADSAYEEWGASGSVRFAPGVGGQGLAVTVAPAWGATANAVDTLWAQSSPADRAVPGQRRQAAGRLHAEVGYGWTLFTTGLLTPYAGISVSAGESRTYRTGARWTLTPATALQLEAVRTENATVVPEHWIGIQVNLR